ncbi:MAG: pyridoxamine 5'-phosphate oxidase family protein [Candidatus Babeliales bacterium]
MAKHIGVTLPKDLVELLKKGTVGVVATFSEKGLPHTTPIQTIYPKGSEALLISIHKEHQGYHNMVWQKKVMINFLGEENVAYSVLGRAGVVRAPSLVHPLMNIVQLDIIDIKSDVYALAHIESGVKYSYPSWEAEELSKALINELIDLSKTL